MKLHWLFLCSILGTALWAQQGERFAGAKFWSAFDGPPLRSGQTIYQENGISLSFEILKSKEASGAVEQFVCEVKNPVVPEDMRADGQVAHHYYLRFTLSNNTPDKVLQFTHVPGISFRMEKRENDVKALVCHNIPGITRNDIKGNLTTMSPGEYLTWNDRDHGGWYFEKPQITEWAVGSYILTPTPQSQGLSSGQRYQNLINAAQQSFKEGRYKEAIDFYQQALKEEGDPILPERRIREIRQLQQQRTRALLNQAEQAMAREDYTGASTLLIEALEIDPELSRVMQDIRKVQNLADAQREEEWTKALEEEDSWEDELASSLEADFEGSSSEPDMDAWEQRSREQAGDLAASNTQAGSGASSEPSPNYSSAKCQSIQARLKPLYQKISQLERQMWRDPTNIEVVERVGQQLENLYDQLSGVQEDMLQASRANQLSPECLESIRQIHQRHSEGSFQEAERGLNNVQRRLNREMGR